MISHKWSPMKRLIWLRGSGITGGSATWSTVTGNPVSFAAKAAPLKQLSVAFTPKQDLHGYDSPWPAGGGKNKIVPKDTTLTINGVSVVCSSSAETVTLTGTGTANGGRTTRLCELVTLSAGTYRFRTYGNVTVRVALNDANNNVLGWGYTSFTLEAETQVYFGVNIEEGKVYNETFRVCVTAGAEEQTTWTPYSNICPILGWDSLNVEQRGKNLIDPATKEKTSQNVARWCYANGFMLRAGQTYTLSSDMAGTTVYIDDKATGETLKNGGTATFTPTQDTLVYFRAYLAGGIADVNLQLELGSTASAYVPYNPSSRTISINLGDTYYSGWVDAVTGVGEVTWAACHIKDTTAIIKDVATTDGFVFIVWPPMTQFGIVPFTYMFCSCYKFVNPNQMGVNSHAGELGWYMAGTNRFCKIASLAQTVEDFRTELDTLDPVVVCPLATPIPFHVDPQAISSLEGDNTMWSDANGDLTVEYRSN